VCKIGISDRKNQLPNVVVHKARLLVNLVNCSLKHVNGTFQKKKQKNFPCKNQNKDKNKRNWLLDGGI